MLGWLIYKKKQNCLGYEGCLESNLQWAVSKTDNEKKCYYIQKNMYMNILKLLFSIITAIETLVILGNKFLYGIVKEICCLWAQPHFDTFQLLIIIAEVPWSHSVCHVGTTKQLVAALSEIRTVRRVVRELRLKYSSRAWVWTALWGLALSWRGAMSILDVSISYLLFWISKVF
jgi:hypothetical protein